jgi:hypothetical protein
MGFRCHCCPHLSQQFFNVIVVNSDNFCVDLLRKCVHFDHERTKSTYYKKKPRFCGLSACYIFQTYTTILDWGSHHSPTLSLLIPSFAILIFLFVLLKSFYFPPSFRPSSLFPPSYFPLILYLLLFLSSSFFSCPLISFLFSPQPYFPVL